LPADLRSHAYGLKICDFNQHVGAPQKNRDFAFFYFVDSEFEKSTLVRGVADAGQKQEKEKTKTRTPPKHA